MGNFPILEIRKMETRREPYYNHAKVANGSKPSRQKLLMIIFVFQGNMHVIRYLQEASFALFTPALQVLGNSLWPNLKLHTDLHGMKYTFLT